LLLLLLDALTVHEAIETIGFGWFQVKLTLIIGIGWVCLFVFFFILLSCALFLEIAIKL